jgi:adsorption protein B
VRQKSRWVFGIVLQEGNRHHWEGNFKTKMSLVHDRKALYTHFVNMGGYFIFIYLFIANFFPQVGLVNFVEAGSLIWYIMMITLVLMLHRWMERFIAVTRHYGPFQGFLSIFRFVFGNVVNFHALLVSLSMYSQHMGHTEEVKWHKTDHEFPQLKD